MSNAPQASEVGHDYMPSIVCVNKSTIPLGVDWPQLLAALDKYVNAIFAPVWRTPAKIVDGGTKTIISPGCWGLVFLDDTDRQNNLGYHDLTPDGQPLGKVFVRDVLNYGKKVSVTASHELSEMLVDPGIHMGARGPDENSWYAYETADAVESSDFPVDGIAMSNFVYPAWFEPFRAPDFDPVRLPENLQQAVRNSSGRLHAGLSGWEMDPKGGLRCGGDWFVRPSGRKMDPEAGCYGSGSLFQRGDTSPNGGTAKAHATLVQP